jgi:hypothetical protein
LKRRTLLIETLHALVTAKVVIERPILLDQDHHVVNIRYFGAAVYDPGNFVRRAASGQQRSCAGTGTHLEHLAARQT